MDLDRAVPRGRIGVGQMERQGVLPPWSPTPTACNLTPTGTPGLPTTIIERGFEDRARGMSSTGGPLPESQLVRVASTWRDIRYICDPGCSQLLVVHRFDGLV
ncbi:hypothetical protein Tter_2358 [Thermobaculum terrenum ATCC BAA-798]|uniref:Uncharacterized protein n=1 Tax=Thermobaculum terrenum (strain ATCC BAA-798 / CCMEE 7001 / YNP1) TaxID=525904 RepID=D1CHN6_THET1|nr:hypothetical protein Tter_2358 [Thermobaculum terrenum ATCC BAA-798]